MAKERNAIQVGFVTLGCVLLAFAVLIWLSKGITGDMQTVHIRFKSTPAMPTIVPGSAVFVGGQQVGKVIKAELKSMPVSDAGERAESVTAAEDYYVMVTTEILRKYKLRPDCKAIPEGPPLGGDGVIKLNLGTVEGEFDGPYIEGAEPGGFGAILATLQGEFDETNPGSLLGQLKGQLDPEGEQSLMAKLLKSLDDINTMTAALSAELNPEQQRTLMAKLHAVVDSINATTGSLRGQFVADDPEVLLGKLHLAMDTMNNGLGMIDAVLKHSAAPIEQTFSNLAATSEHIATETDPNTADSLMAYFKQASRQLNTALADINDFTSTTRDIMILNRENVNKLLMNFKEASDHIKTGVAYVLRHPWRLFNEPSQQEIKEQTIFDAARSFAEAAMHIDDAADQLRALAEVHGGNIPTDDPDLQRIRADLKRTQENYRRAENEFWQKLGK